MFEISENACKSWAASVAHEIGGPCVCGCWRATWVEYPPIGYRPHFSFEIKCTGCGSFDSLEFTRHPLSQYQLFLLRKEAVAYFASHWPQIRRAEAEKSELALLIPEARQSGKTKGRL